MFPQDKSTGYKHLSGAPLTHGFLKFLTRFSGRRRVSLLRLPFFSYQCKNASSHYYLNICKLNSVIPIFLLLLSTIIDVTDSCNSRTVPRPRTTSQPSSTARPNITFQTFKCPEAYATWYCLNGATCFTVKIGKEVLYNCECPDGYIGPRCDYKDLEGSYLVGRPRVMLETASIAGGAIAALFLSFVVGFFVYVRWHQSKKREIHDQESYEQPRNGHTNTAADVVDGVSDVGCCLELQSEEHNFNSQQERNQVNRTNNVDRELQHNQQQQLQSTVNVPRPFGQHHYHPLSMSEVLLKI